MDRNGRGFRAEYTNIPGRGSSNQPDRQPQLQRQVSRTQNVRPMNTSMSRVPANGKNPSLGSNRNPNARVGYPMRNAQIKLERGRVNDPPRSSMPKQMPRAVVDTRSIVSERTHAQGRRKSSRRRNTAVRDFFLGLMIGFAVFGTAAVFVVRAVTELFI